MVMMMNDVKKPMPSPSQRLLPRIGRQKSAAWERSRLMMMMTIMAMMKNTARRGSMDFCPTGGFGCGGGGSVRIVSERASERARARPSRSTISCPPVYKHIQHRRRHRDGGHEYSSVRAHTQPDNNARFSLFKLFSSVIHLLFLFFFF